MVQKPNGDLRLCLDCRKLNAVSKPDAYPLPYISSILDQLRDAKYLTSIDLSAAYWQIPYDSEQSADKTAFTVPRRGLFRFNVMSFGLVSASSTMQRLMDRLFGPEFNNKVFCFQDDITIISSTFSEHVQLLHKVYAKLRDANLTINMDKSIFCRRELKYLGYLVDKHGLRTDPGKVDIILNYPTPTSAKEVKRFLGMAGWYRRFINNFPKISKPLNKLTSKNVRFEWTTEADESFNHLKTALVSAPILKCPNFDLPFSIHCDASSVAVGGVLTQTYDGVEHPIAYCSRSLAKNEINFSTSERELMDVIYALEQFRSYVEGTKCKIITDHASLLWFYKLNNPSGRLARWSMRLSQFDFEIEHRKDTGDSKPIKQRYYPLSPVKQLALEKELDRMLSLGVVSPSQSAWNSPVVMVQKPNGDLRLCLDCRKLNAVSKPDAYPLPYISSILDQLRDAKYLTSIDLSAAYWQIPYDSEQSADKTAFTVPRRGLFRFNVMSFGLVSASSTMQRLMDRLFGPEFNNKVFCFQDDIIIISSTFSEHVQLLHKVYAKLRDANLTINMDKSIFCRRELKYLGYLVDKHGLRLIRER
ncbi:unnamed protein product [Parnassius mnemosyne]|uniref:RNA-directed DNA polymerase n=1 Tax=Parnassius mnemosyne TaxID=213953 RepID=A0AAV1L1M0_9NEOP